MAPEADLFVWDFEAVSDDWAGLDLERPGRHIVLVYRTDLERLAERLPPTPVSVLLKPLLPASLRSYLDRFFADLEFSDRASIEELRRDRETVLQCLFAANLRLQEYDQDRTNFLARAVHDFRAPLTALNGYCGLMLNQQLGPLDNRQLEVLQRMQHSITKLSRLSSALFQLSVGRWVETQPKFEDAPIEACVERALEEIAPLAEEKRIGILTSLDPPEQPLFFDPAQMEQVLVNLLDNACKFTPRNGLIELRGFPTFWERRNPRIQPGGLPEERRQEVSRTPNAYRLEVSDNGPGVPPQQLESIFEEYTSYSGGKDRSGGGLGLAICRMILRAHNGRIVAQSNGRGITFVLLLPFPQPGLDARMGNGPLLDAV
jgi:signal transduction histidine kinase